MEWNVIIHTLFQVKDQAKTLLMLLAKEKEGHSEVERHEVGSDMEISQTEEKHSTLDASESGDS
jgi:hypothetical protein